jgi:hypothetical protein
LNPEFLDVDDVLEIHAAQIAEHGASEGVRDRSLWESAIAQPMAQLATMRSRLLFAFSPSSGSAVSAIATHAAAPCLRFGIRVIVGLRCCRHRAKCQSRASDVVGASSIISCDRDVQKWVSVTVSSPEPIQSARSSLISTASPHL